MSNKKNIREKKRCTKCLALLSQDQFYSKGNRLDSSCKDCKKKQVKTTYLAQVKRADLKVFNKFIKLACEIERIKISDDLDVVNKILRRHDVGSF